MKYSAKMRYFVTKTISGLSLFGLGLFVCIGTSHEADKIARGKVSAYVLANVNNIHIFENSARILKIQNRSATAQGKSTLNLDSERTAKDRKAILSNLYERLQASDSRETSERLIQAIEKIWLTSGSDTIDLLMARASSAFEKNNYKLAKQLLDSITDLDPNYSEGWSKRAMVAFKQDDFLSSLKDLERVLALDPRHFRAIQGLGLILQQFGKKKQALELYRKVLKINPYSESAQQAESELAREVEGQGI